MCVADRSLLPAVRNEMSLGTGRAGVGSGPGRDKGAGAVGVKVEGKGWGRRGLGGRADESSWVTV